MATKNDTGKFRKIASFESLQNFILTSSPKTLKVVLHNSTMRKIVTKILEKQLQRNLFNEKDSLKQVQEDKFNMFKSLMLSVNNMLDNAKNKKDFEKVLTEKVIPSVVKSMSKNSGAKEKFKEKYGIDSPGFLVISPGKLCNLKCTGCYANSSSSSSEKLDWDIVDKIITEKTKDWGSWFTVISGGEPLLWKSHGKTIIDMAEKHPDNFFLMYTNGTLINKEMAEIIAEAGNITPAISVEGFEKETDERRGKGVHKRILESMANLKEVGVPFGISLTATRKNAEIITSEELMKYYWDKGAIYGWIFQLMPIGRGSMDLVVTPEQRLKMFNRTRDLIKKNYFVADFWNCGSVVNGCISAGKATGGGYLYIEWNGNITPCAFNPYAVANINEIYKRGGSLNEVLMSPYFQHIRKWQKDYSLEKPANEIQNLILPCPIRDHYDEIRKFIDEDKPYPIDEAAKQALEDKKYKESMINYDKNLAEVLNPVWEEEYRKNSRKYKR